MYENNGLLIYLDTNVYARPFDDQTKSNIQAEAEAFLKILEVVKSNTFTLLNSDILTFEVENIFDNTKRIEVKEYLSLCTHHISNSEEILLLGQQIEYECHTKSRDALHIASAIIGQARYCLSCDKTVTYMNNAKCYRRLGKKFRGQYFSVMNPIQFIERFEKGEFK